jgi:hypothetical protein
VASARMPPTLAVVLNRKPRRLTDLSRMTRTCPLGS